MPEGNRRLDQHQRAVRKKGFLKRMGYFMAAILSVLGWFGGARPVVFQGYAEGEYVLVGPADGGRLARLEVARGDTVKAGAALFAVDPVALLAARDEAAAQLAAAEAQAANIATGSRVADRAVVAAQLGQAEASEALARVELARAQNLQGGGAMSRQALDEARATEAVDAARVAELAARLKVADEPLGRDAEREAAAAAVAADTAVLAAAQWHLAQAAPPAPAAGLVADTYFRPGEMVAARQPVVSLLPPENIKVRFYVPEGALDRFAAGTRVMLSCDGCGPAIPGRVRYVAPDAEYTPPVLFNRENRASMVFLVEAWPSARATALHPGQPVDVALAP
jgi:HlyD family secretion protein